MSALVAAAGCEDDSGFTFPPGDDPGSSANRAPVLGKSLSAVTAPGVPVTLDLLVGASDPDGDPMTVTSAYQDYAGGFQYVSASVELQRDNRTVQVTSLFGAAGTISIHYAIADGHYHLVNGTASVVVEQAPQAKDTTVSVEQNTPCSLYLQASDPEGATLTYKVTSQPVSGTLSGTAPNLTYTPTPGFVGKDSFTFTVSDGHLTSQPATVTIITERPNQRPTASAQTVIVDENTRAAITLAGDDPDGDPLSFSIWSWPAHGTLEVLGSTVYYTPFPDYEGPDSFRFIASDAVSTSDPATVAITAAHVNHRPFAFDRFVNLNEDSSAEVSLFATDSDGDPLTYKIQDKPRHGELTGTGPNLTYVPKSDYNGPDSFTYVASDGIATSAPATVTLSIAAVNDAPVATDDTVSTAEDTPVAITLRASDVDSPLLSYSISALPADGTLTGSGTSWTYRPAANANGKRTFTFRVSDGWLSATATVTIVISPVDDAPQAVDDFVATDAGEALTVDLRSNDIDVDGDELSLISVGAPAHGHADIVSGQLVYTPDADFTGVDVFEYTVADPAGTPSTASVHVGVGQFPQDAPTETIRALAVDFNDRRYAPSLSGDGRYIAFATTSALVADDKNGAYDVYVYDRGTRTVSRVSESSTGQEANGPSRAPRISMDGRYVAFESVANNLVSGDTNKANDVFRHDRATGETVRVSVASGGGQASGASQDPRISDDGNMIVFTSSAFDLIADDANSASDVFVHDMTANTTARVSVSTTGGDADLPSAEPALSGDGRFVAFTSAATNLVPGDGNGVSDIFVRDLVTRTTSRISVASTGGEANAASSGASLSRDGRFVSFLSSATNLVTGASGTQVYARDTHELTTIRQLASTSMLWARLSPDGRYLAGLDGGGVLLRDRRTATTAAPAGAQSWTWPSFSGTGRYVVVLSGGNLVVAANPL